MLLLGVVLCELLLAYVVVKTIPWFLWTLCALFYALGYFWLDDGPKTGHRSWNRTRAFGCWRQLLPVRVDYTGSQDKIRQAGSVMYIVMGSTTHLPLLYVFGLCPPTTLCSFIMPHVLFYVPVLRDALLCLGAVSATPTTYGDTITHMHTLRRSVAFASPDKHQVSLEWFQLARTLNMPVVPVYVSGERERYAMAASPYPPLTEYCAQRWGWPFPVLFAPRILGRTPPERLQVVVGSVMNPSVFEDDESFRDFFTTQLNAFPNNV